MLYGIHVGHVNSQNASGGHQLWVSSIIYNKHSEFQFQGGKIPTRFHSALICLTYNTEAIYWELKERGSKHAVFSCCDYGNVRTKAPISARTSRICGFLFNLYSSARGWKQSWIYGYTQHPTGTLTHTQGYTRTRRCTRALLSSRRERFAESVSRVGP